MNRKAFLAILATIAFGVLPLSSYATIIGFEGLTGSNNSFPGLGIQNTYFGHTWSAANSAQSPTEWGAAEGSVGGLSAQSGTGYAWTFNGGQSMFVDFSTAQNVAGVWGAGQFGGSSASTIQLFGFDALNNIIGQSAVLNLALGQWQFLSGAALNSLAVSRLEIRSNAATTWFGLDNLDIRDAEQVEPVPAPATLALFGLGLAGLGWSRRKKA